MEKLDLEAIRRRIDKIDAQLVAALEEIGRASCRERV